MRRVAALAVVAFAACTEHVPKLIVDDAGAPPAPTDPWGLDVRPVNPACAPRVLAPQGFSSIVRATSYTFQNAIDVLAHDGKTYALEQGGFVGLLDGTLVADVSGRIVSGGEAGLLGIAFHPKFAQNGFVFLSYTAPGGAGVFQSVIARYQSKDGGATIDLSTEKRILVFDQPFANHNGGTIMFGPDGFLYLGFGDGGSGGDPLGNGQNTNVLLGKMLRIDVDGGDPYAIPPSNPFAAGGGRPEIFAWGLRNPWRFAFDPPTGRLFAGDVGQNTREEVDEIFVGKNYGWNVREGTFCYNATTCDTTGLTEPLVDYGRDKGGSVSGGFVYHGTSFPSLAGKYVFADFNTGRFFAMRIDVPSPTLEDIDIGVNSVNPTAVVPDVNGEIIFTDYFSGLIWRIVPPVASDLPDGLEQTGCVDERAPTKPAQGLFPYAVNVPQWMDGIVADRFISIPADSKIATKADGALELPPGSIAMRILHDGTTPLETQMLLRRADGEWKAYDWVYRTGIFGAAVGNTSTCMQCHTKEAHTTIGLEVAQLDRDFDYGGRHGNQIATLDHVGMLAQPPAPGAFPPLPALEANDSAERRSRAYLHANCAFCHRGGELEEMDLRFSLSFPNTRTCNVDGRILPGDPDHSTIISRMRATDATHMPPLASKKPDDRAVTTISDWIRALPGCMP
jgi:glucose/arabinose dehydrogenase